MTPEGTPIPASARTEGPPVGTALGQPAVNLGLSFQLDAHPSGNVVDVVKVVDVDVVAVEEVDVLTATLSSSSSHSLREVTSSASCVVELVES